MSPDLAMEMCMGDPEARLAREQGKARNEEINGELKRDLEEKVI